MHAFDLVVYPCKRPALAAYLRDRASVVGLRPRRLFLDDAA
jgi:hypothetical protein